MNWLAISAVVAFLTACGGGSASSPAAPAAPAEAAPLASIDGSCNAITASSACCANLPAAAPVLNYVANKHKLMRRSKCNC